MAYEPPNGGNNAYLAAIENVNSTIAFMKDVAVEFLGESKQSIQALGNWHPDPEGTPPDIHPKEVVPTGLPTFPAPNPNLFGEVGGLTEPLYEDLRDLIDKITIDDPGPFNPKTALPTAPPPPSPIDLSGRPDRPVLNPVTVPDDPDITMPAPGVMLDINDVQMPTINLPAFDIGEIPLFDTPTPDLAFHYVEATYTPQVLAETTATIKAMLAGNFAMPKTVQDALWAAAVDREDISARKAVAEAFEDWASRGFSMPTGMLVEQVNAARDTAQLAANTASRDAYTKAAEWQIENLRTAVAQGIALEAMWTQHWNQVQQRAFEAAKVAVDLVKDQFNLYAQAFTLKLQGIAARREVFETLLRVELAKLEIVKEQIAVEQLKGTVNEQTVRIFVARLDGVKTLAQVFASKLEGAKIRSDIEISKLTGFKTDVEAWSARIAGDKTRFDAYDSQMRGMQAQASAYESEARAYSATVAAASDRNNSRARVVEAKLKAIETSVQKFLGLLQGASAVVNARRDAIAARAQAFAADTARWGEQLKYASSGEEIRIRAQEASTRNNMAYFEVLSRQFESRMQRLLQTGLALKDAIAQGGTMNVQLTAGAMSAIHAQAGVSGSGSDSYSHSYDYKYNMTPNAPDPGA